ncbi:hypothetical protein ASPZODRAFT_129524 [Penicilliopsis zonata CBS 506.65]|uniref:EKC/KEOPS complex subunit BUD32 n=1 Tax=Penicilliopsis zonata CBS 506.65 TaxID=1073090 RepID=A0A1L9SPC3_9EURO|nr:hypothetical protein ASPZODRAFT_129524 [Penicilliopsis zonata CBS 506.65]OJJ49119.1 hypothetical protein ASPZODRAFT_129524 [Penicilliopsis zonata CBS 506.65]
MRYGNLRKYIQKQANSLDDGIKGRWVQNAIMAVAHLHHHGIIHADISPRNFLVADDLTIKLCDFGGSGIGELQSLVAEECYQSPGPRRTVETDLFALGCLVYEFAAGSPPYADIEWEEIGRRYKRREFPSLDHALYRDIIRKCWTFQYTKADQTLRDLEQQEKPRTDS